MTTDVMKPKQQVKISRDERPGRRYPVDAAVPDKGGDRTKGSKDVSEIQVINHNWACDRQLSRGYRNQENGLQEMFHTGYGG